VFEQMSYIGYTLLFCIPPLILMWLRKEFFLILQKNVKTIVLSTVILTLYGCLIWPIALKYGVWSYSPEKITNVKLLGFVFLDDIIWWIFVGLVFSSFISISAHYEDQGIDIVSREIKAFFISFKQAFKGLSIIPLERNSTIHVAVAVFVLLEGMLFRVTSTEWLFIVTAIGSVLAFEIINSVVERLASRLTDEQPDKEIGTIKDASAAAVLVSSMAAAVIGIVIFLSRVIALLTG